MALDYSQLSDADLEAIAADDYSKLSDDALKVIAGDTPEAETEAARIAREQAPDTWGDVAGKTAAAVGTGMAIGKDIVSPIINNPWAQKAATVGAELYGAKKLIADPIVRAMGGGATPTTFTGGANTAFDAALSKPYNAVRSMLGRTAAAVAPAAQAAIPQAAMLAPYAMAAHEQSKIRLNPSAPQYANNPYAMQQRGEAPTQAAAGAINQQAALINQPYGRTGSAAPTSGVSGWIANKNIGGLTPQEQQMLAQDRQRQIQVQQDRAILKQQPTAQNYIERMKALSNLYGGVSQ